jgi:hypothetical protein
MRLFLLNGAYNKQLCSIYVYNCMCPKRHHQKNDRETKYKTSSYRLKKRFCSLLIGFIFCLISRRRNLYSLRAVLMAQTLKKEKTSRFSFARAVVYMIYWPVITSVRLLPWLIKIGETDRIIR